ncbi:Zinc finger protein 93 [Eumeta japonica]|uniref:Zinc finger protein 93 n=1 Tax=Eumeta variegata TaxID=151549 RepID=A0A4C1VUC4_EUMVA|nr:Zinc finger protein 93 [Eumeta japonica]
MYLERRCVGASSRKKTSSSANSNEKEATIRNAVRLIQYSNMCPFRWNLQYQYKCFCCEKMFRDIKLLKVHTRSRHGIQEIKTKITRHCQSLHNVDISSLRCNECDVRLSDIVDLKRHLSEEHSMIMEPAEDVLVPFKLEDDVYKCALCPEQFQHLHSFNIHMNTHFKNFVCHICGAGFRCSNRMSMHLKRHGQRLHRCGACDVTFASSYKKQKHDVAVHDKKLRMKYPLCSERFHEYYARLAHQISVHNAERPKHECQFCHKQYLFRHRLQQHIRREHLKERNHACEECGRKFFARDMLKRHMISHNGAKIHECSFCKKSYARRGTLREHMKIHLNIRKWICNVCGEAFIQNCSLKNHLKKHR